MVPRPMSTSASPAGRAAADLEPGARETSLAAQAARVSGPAPVPRVFWPETLRQGDTSAAAVIGALSKGVLRT
jgi:hypothetical protein